MSEFLREVKEQGRALRAVAEVYRDQGGPLLAEAARLAAGRPVLFTGMGSSWAAALAAESHLVSAGRLAMAVDAGEALYRWAALIDGPRSVFPVLISQSGESRELVRLAGRLSSPFIAITNAPESSLARRAAVVLPLHAGEEEGATNKTFLNTIAVTAILGRTLLAEGSEEGLLEMARLLEIAEFLEAASAIDQVLARGEDSIALLRRHLVNGEVAGPPAPAARAGGPPPGAPKADGAVLPWELIGRGSALAAVHQGALVLRELTGRVIASFTGGLYRHGPVYRSGPWTRAIVLAARSEEGSLLARLVREILDRGGRVALLSDFDPEIDSPLLFKLQLPAVARGLFPLVGMVPLELLGAIDARLRGFESGRGVPKVTPVE